MYLHVIQPKKFRTFWRLLIKELVKFKNPKLVIMSLNMNFLKCYMENISRTSTCALLNDQQPQVLRKNIYQ